ncbi:MAG: DUF58 domain-containing protein [Burkholderiales bacterium]|nr:MAG: DUF58 domain-containing protein [Burkholderiales bacterium]
MEQVSRSAATAPVRADDGTPARSAGLHARIEDWFARSRRHDPPELTLDRRRVYVLPSRPGVLYGVFLALMLVSSINYQVSLGYALTFLLGAVGIVGLLHCYRNLAGLRVRPGRAEPVFAGDLIDLSFSLHNASRVDRYAIGVAAEGMAQPELVDVAGETETMVRVALPSRRRGRHRLPRFRLFGKYPLGIWQAWGYWNPRHSVLVYPRPEQGAPPPPELTALAGEAPGGGFGIDDVAALRPYVPGDAPRVIAWKAIARTASDELLSKQFEGGYQGELWLDWQALPDNLDSEERLSRLTRWVLDAESSGMRYGLRLPARTVEIDRGPAHRTVCLEALALAEV